jgi:hypothetical protein
MRDQSTGSRKDSQFALGSECVIALITLTLTLTLCELAAAQI